MLVRTYAFIIVAFAASVLLQAQLAQPNLLPNGGFESPGLPSNQDMLLLTNGSTYVSGWTVIDDGVGQPPFYGNTDLNDAVLNGEYGLVLNQGSGVRTTFRTEFGSFYELSLWIRPDDCMSCQNPAPLQVTIGGASYLIPQLPGWTYQTIQFFATNRLSTLQLFNQSSPRDYKRYTIDDVAIRKVDGGILTVRLAPVVTVEGTIGAKYQIQAATNLTAPVWTTLTNLTLSNNPTFFMDTNNLSPAATRTRVYRAIRIQ
jgi:hypothetical protein